MVEHFRRESGLHFRGGRAGPTFKGGFPALYEIAEAKGSFIVMCYLEGHGPMTKYELTRGTRLSKEAIDHALSVLSRLGLCAIEKIGAFPFSRRIQLTGLGDQFLDTPVRDLPSFFWQNQRLGHPGQVTALKVSPSGQVQRT